MIISSAEREERPICISIFSFDLKEKPLLKSINWNDEIPKSKIIASAEKFLFTTVSILLNFSLKKINLSGNKHVKIIVQIILFGIKKDFLHKVASSIRLLRKPDAYKGKGILFDNESLRLKEGKKK